jgi:hypothetical protein
MHLDSQDLIVIRYAHKRWERSSLNRERGKAVGGEAHREEEEAEPKRDEITGAQPKMVVTGGEQRRSLEREPEK